MKYEITKQKYFTIDELETIMSNFETKPPTRRYITFISLLMYTGARVSEILNLDYRYIPLDGHSIPIKGLKGSRDRDIVVPPEIAEVVSMQIHQRTLDDAGKTFDAGSKCPLIDMSYRRAVQIWESIRPVAKPLKAFRHSFAINLYKKTKDVFVVQTALGHASFTSTQVYLEHLMREQSLKKLSNIDLYGRDDD